MRLFVMSFCLLMLAACEAAKTKSYLTEDAETAKAAIGLKNAEDLWRCAGKVPDKDKEYIASALQKNNSGQKVLMASYVFVNGKSVIQKYLFTTNVEAKDTNDFKEAYYEVTTKAPSTVLLGTYDYSGEEAVLMSDKVSTLPVKIDCRLGVVK